MTTVLLIEDETDIRRYLRTTLIAYDYDVLEAATAKEGLQKLTLGQPDLVILDLGLPDLDGQEFIKVVREWTQTPIIVLSAREHETEKVTALESGADDYLTKPFSPAELLARLKVALRHVSPARAPVDDVFEYNGLKVNHVSAQIWLDGQEIHLTPIEFRLLTTLIRHPGKVLTHAQLLKTVWGRNSGEQNHYLRIHTQHLREKLGDDPLDPRFILTRPGIGYGFKT